MQNNKLKKFIQTCKVLVLYLCKIQLVRQPEKSFSYKRLVRVAGLVCNPNNLKITIATSRPKLKDWKEKSHKRLQFLVCNRIVISSVGHAIND